PFSQVTIQKTGTALQLLTTALSIENVELATAVPEPSAVATAGLFAAAAIVAARRRRAAARSAENADAAQA
ncbi:MAG: PEP-CTERM sorting domain-containing protein, partial [Planctomyces sp.]